MQLSKVYVRRVRTAPLGQGDMTIYLLWRYMVSKLYRFQIIVTICLNFYSPDFHVLMILLPISWNKFTLDNTRFDGIISWQIIDYIVLYDLKI